MLRRISSVGFILILGACGTGLNQTPATDSRKPVPTQVLYRDSRCPAAQPGIQVIRDSGSWVEWQKQRQQLSFSASQEPDTATADLDFGRLNVIVISMGQKPTPGYSVDVPESSVALQGTSLTIRSIWQQPPEGAILAQVITNPCIAITVTAAEYSTVTVENQDGDAVFVQ